jgi:hypothetical protein
LARSVRCWREEPEHVLPGMRCWLDPGEDLGGGCRLPLLHGVGVAEGGVWEDGGRREDGGRMAELAEHPGF